MAIHEFKNDEYINWQDDNPSNFIVNTRKYKNSTLFVLHKSRCPHIYSKSGFVNPNVFIGLENTKIGSDKINELKLWFEKNYEKFKGEFIICKSCNPF